MRYYYAQINENKICDGVSDHSEPIIENNLIPIENLDSSFIGKKFENNQWVEIPEPKIEETIIPEPTQLDRIEAALNMKNEEISENAIDTYTKQLLESGLL